jgi:hypothetical protein
VDTPERRVLPRRPVRGLLEVVDHYNTFFGLGLSEQEKHDLVEYLKSI